MSSDSFRRQHLSGVRGAGRREDVVQGAGFGPARRGAGPRPRGRRPAPHRPRLRAGVPAGPERQQPVRGADLPQRAVHRRSRAVRVPEAEPALHRPAGRRPVWRGERAAGGTRAMTRTKSCSGAGGTRATTRAKSRSGRVR